MKHRRILGSVVLCVSCVCMALPASAQPKTPKRGAAATTKPAVAATPPVAHTHPKPGPTKGPAAKGPHETKDPHETKPGKEAATAAAPEGPRSASAGHQVVEHESHIEFDERMVRGQSAAGAIYLFRRAPSDFKSIVQVPDGFRDRTVEIVATRRGAP